MNKMFARIANLFSMKTTRIMCPRIWVMALAVSVCPLPVLAVQITDAEVGSYVVRDGVIILGIFNKGHAGLISGMDSSEKPLVIDIEGAGDVVAERLYTDFLKTKTTGVPNNLMGVGHPSALQSMTPLNIKMYRAEIKSQAARAIGRPYVYSSSDTLGIGFLWKNPPSTPSLTDERTYVNGGVPQVASKYRCDGLMEWSYEAALAVIDPQAVTTSGFVDPARGAYPVNNGSVLWYGVDPTNLYAGDTSGKSTVTQTVADRPDMNSITQAPPSIIGNNYSVSFGIPYDQSGIKGYRYGWVLDGLIGLPTSFTNTTGVSNQSLPTTSGTYRFLVYAEDKVGHWSNETERYQSPPYIFPAPTISSVPSITSAASQTITIYGSNFTNTSTLVFYDPSNNPWPRTPTSINTATGELRYVTTVAPAVGAWKVKVLNGTVESQPFTFYISSASSSVSTTLTGLSINGPATVNENGTGSFTATALFSDGTNSIVPVTWSVSGSAASINQSTGQLSAGSVSSDTLVTVSASYSTGGVTKTSSANVTIVNSGGGGGTQTQELITNGSFDSGFSGWTLQGVDSWAGTTLTSYRTSPGYAALGVSSGGLPKDNASGAFYQTISIPANATAATLSFWYYISTNETGSTPYDYLYVSVRDSSDVFLTYAATLSNADKTTGYVQKIFDLSPYIGRTIRVRFGATSDSLNTTTFRIDDVSVTATVPAPVTLSSLTINGQSSVAAGGSAPYSATAVFSDGSTQAVTATGWSVNSGYASISNGYFNAGQVLSDTIVTISTSYTSGSVTQTATKNVTIVAPVIVVPTYSSLFISGPSSINENSSGQFTAAAIFSDGSAQSVLPSWSLSSGVASINQSTGQLSAGGVSSDTSLTVSASYTNGGVTHSASQNVTIINLQSAQAVSFGAAPTIVVGGAGTVSATASSSLPVSFISLTPSICTISGSTVNGITAGTCIIAADQGGNTNYYAAPQTTQTITIGTTSKFSQAIGTINFSPATLAVGGTTTASATASSSLLVNFSSTTPSVCTVSGTNGSTVTRISAGTCTIAADQAGDANYTAATQVIQSIMEAATAPSAPTIGNATGGNTQATVSFTAPTNTGGSTITGYTVTSVPAGGVDTNAGTTALTHTITGLTNGTVYTFTVTATNSVGTSAASATSNSVIPVPTIAWTTKAPIPTANYWLSSTVVSGVIYTIGWSYNQAFDPAVNSWSTKATVPTSRVGLSVSTVNGVVYAIGGNGGGSSYYSVVEAYDPAANSWSTRSPMSVARSEFSTAVVNGLIYAIGGYNYGAVYSSMEAYDPVTNAWTAKTAMPTARTSFSTSVVNGVIYAIGGASGASTFSTVEAYNATGASATICGVTVAAGTWTSACAAMPTARYGLSTSAVNGVIYAMGGNDRTNALSIVEAFDPTTNSWSTNAAMPAVRQDFSTSVVNGVIYAIGGSSAETWAYTPLASQNIGTISFSPTTLAVSGTTTISATATSGLAVSFSSTTPSICTVSGNTVTGVAKGACTIAADQAGNATYNAATQLTQNITVTDTASSAPSISSVSPNPVIGVALPGRVSMTLYGANFVNGLRVTMTWTAAGGGSATLSSANTNFISSAQINLLVATDMTADNWTVKVTNPDGQLSNIASFSVIPVKASQTVSFGAAPTIVVGGTGNVSATATSGLAVSFTSVTPGVCTVSGSTVTVVTAGACTIAADQAGNAIYNAAAQITQNITIGNTPGAALNLVPSWNLVGNSISVPLSVATTFGDATKVSTVWKWVAATSKWAFYTPTIADGGAAYAANKGYDSLATINGGEGFWVNAKTAFTASLPTGTAIVSSSFADQLTGANNLPSGWSLIAVGDNPTPKAFANTIALNPPSAGTIVATSLTTLWAWDSTSTSWYFYAPSLDNSGGLVNYVTSKNYFDFTAKGKTLDSTTGFWVNHP